MSRRCNRLDRVSTDESQIFQMLQDARLVLRRYRVSHVLRVLRTVLLEVLSRLQTRLWLVCPIIVNFIVFHVSANVTPLRSARF